MSSDASVTHIPELNKALTEAYLKHFDADNPRIAVWVIGDNPPSDDGVDIEIKGASPSFRVVQFDTAYVISPVRLWNNNLNEAYKTAKALMQHLSLHNKDIEIEMAGTPAVVRRVIETNNIPIKIHCFFGTPSAFENKMKI
jgi:hypothetical protein